MRFPKTSFMERTFKLASKLSLKLLPYNMEVDNTFLLYNHRIYRQDAPLTGDPFNVSGYVDPDLTSPIEVKNKVASVLAPFRNLFAPDSSGNQPDIAAAMATLFDETNTYSMRSYMFQNGMSAEDISWCETLDKSTGWYDRALAEST